MFAFEKLTEPSTDNPIARFLNLVKKERGNTRHLRRFLWDHWHNFYDLRIGTSFAADIALRLLYEKTLEKMEKTYLVMAFPGLEQLGLKFEREVTIIETPAKVLSVKVWIADSRKLEETELKSPANIAYNIALFLDIVRASFEHLQYLLNENTNTEEVSESMDEYFDQYSFCSSFDDRFTYALKHQELRV